MAHASTGCFYTGAKASYFVFFGFLILLIFMPLPTWSDLAKSLTDDETIEEAIARLIAAHEADADAHIDTGESLQTHKAATIIDHIARSVYRDKLAFDRFQIDEHFSSADAWTKSGGAFLDNLGQFSLTTNGDESDVQYAYILPGDSMENGGAAAASPIWEARYKFAQATAQTAYFGQLDPNTPVGYGFKVVNGNLYTVYWDDESTEQTEQISGVTVTDWHNFRCEYVSGVSLKWFVDGVLKKTLLSGLPTGFSIFHYFQITADAAAVKLMYLQSFHYDEDYTS